jgi:hypothetical protein
MKNKEIDKPEIHLEYKGYTAVCTPNPKDKGRYYGWPCHPEHPNKPMKDWTFAGDTPEEAEKHFKSQVCKIIEYEEYRNKQKTWKDNTDWESIGAVFDILPDKFLERIEAETFDKHLLDEVRGGVYAVPLCYVTKAWDVLLKGSLESWSFMIGPEEDYDFSEETLREYLEEEEADRSRGQAISDNDRMKAIWKEKFGIDIDGLEVDFTQFGMHIPLKVSKEDYYWHFLDVPDGIVEWVMDGINHPSGGCSFDSVSSLMEFTAMIELVRKNKFSGYC